MEGREKGGGRASRCPMAVCPGRAWLSSWLLCRHSNASRRLACMSGSTSGGTWMEGRGACESERGSRSGAAPAPARLPVGGKQAAKGRVGHYKTRRDITSGECAIQMEANG